MQSDRVCLSQQTHSAIKRRSLVENLLFYDKEHGRLISTSSYSTRNIMNVDGKEDVNCDTIQHSRSSINNKTFLYASQILGKVNKFEEKFKFYNSSAVTGGSATVRPSFTHKLKKKKIQFFQDSLKSLLEYRCFVLLNEEKKSCVQQTQNIIADLKCMYAKKVMKLRTMPVLTYNHFFNCSEININVLKQLLKKFIFICDMHSSLRNNYREFFFSNFAFDMGLYEMLLKVNNCLRSLNSQLFYWAYKVLEVFIFKLSLADPNTISPELLHDVVNICAISSSLYLKREIMSAYLINKYYVSFNCLIQFKFQEIFVDFILQYLPHFEAKIAAEKIMKGLIYEFKYSCPEDVLKEKDKSDKQVLFYSTSDYYSTSSTHVDIVDPPMHSNENFNFNNIYMSILQRNQSLVLKYLYSTTCLDSSRKNKDTFEKQGGTLAGTKAWHLPQNTQKNKQYLILEEKYWIHFWNNVISFSLKLVLEVTFHQYGKSAVGIFLFWPCSHHYAMLNYLWSSSKNKDVSVAGSDAMQKIYYSLLTGTIYESWKKEMSYSLSLMNGQPFFPIPVASNGVRTRIGNALYSCLQVLRLDASDDFFYLENIFVLKLYLLQITLDYFVFVMNVNARAFISAFDLTSYLLLCRSDCVYACKVLKIAESYIFPIPKYQRLFSFNNLKNSVIKQIHTLAGYVSEAETIIYHVISRIVRRNSLYLIKKKASTNILFSNNLQSGGFLIVSLNEILNSFNDTVNHVCDGSGILYAITSAVADQLLSVLEIERKKLSMKKVELLKRILSDFMKWLERQNIDPSLQESIDNINSFNKLVYIIHILETYAANQRCCQMANNKILPIASEPNFDPSNILTEEEKLQWQFAVRSTIFFCC